MKTKKLNTSRETNKRKSRRPKAPFSFFHFVKTLLLFILNNLRSSHFPRLFLSVSPLCSNNSVLNLDLRFSKLHSDLKFRWLLGCFKKETFFHLNISSFRSFANRFAISRYYCCYKNEIVFIMALILPQFSFFLFDQLFPLTSPLSFCFVFNSSSKYAFNFYNYHYYSFHICSIWFLSL